VSVQPSVPTFSLQNVQTKLTLNESDWMILPIPSIHLVETMRWAKALSSMDKNKVINCLKMINKNPNWRPYARKSIEEVRSHTPAGTSNPLLILLEELQKNLLSENLSPSPVQVFNFGNQKYHLIEECPGDEEETVHLYKATSSN